MEKLSGASSTEPSVSALVADTTTYWRSCRNGLVPKRNPLDELDVRTLRRVLWHGQRPAYESYLRSSRWREFRKLALELANYSCQRCGSSEHTNRLLVLDVHHVTYTRLGRERMSDVEVLCRPCHQQADRERRRSRRQ